MTQNKFWKHPVYSHVYCGDLPTPEGRLCWISLVTPKAPPPPKEGETPGQPRYEATLLLDKKSKAVIKFLADLEALIQEGLVLFNKGRAATIGIASVLGKYGDGDTWDHEKYPYYKGCWALTARNAQAMQIVDKLREKVAPEVVKGGMPARFVVTPLITAHGVSFKLLVLQTLDDDGLRFGGGAREVLDLLSDLEADDTKECETADSTETKAEVEATPAAEVVKKTVKGKQAAVNLLA